MNPGEGTYNLKVCCTNCEHRWMLKLPLGQPFMTWGYHVHTCPNCGCKAVQKDPKATP